MLETLAQRNLNNQTAIRKVSARVVSVSTDNTSATLQLVDESNSTIVLYNKTGEFLSAGETVWVHYWKTVTDGYIAIRCGETNYSGGTPSGEGEPYVGELPLHRSTRAGTSYLLTEDTHEYVTEYSYDVESESESTTLPNAPVGLISSYWSSELGHDTYMTNCDTSNGGILYFAWVPRRTGTGTSASAEAPLHVYSDITVPEVVSNQIVNRRYYIKPVLQSNNLYDIQVAMVESGVETIVTTLNYDVAYENVQNYKIAFVVGTDDTEEDDTAHVIKYNPYISLPAIHTFMYRAYYNPDSSLWGIEDTYVSWKRECVVAARLDAISVDINKNVVEETKVRSVIA